MWADFYQNGGWGMYPTTVFGFVLILSAVLLVLRPERRWVPVVVGTRGDVPMTCKRVSEDLVAFHFGTVTEDQRTAVEAHLPTCADCLRAYLAVKREIETAASTQRPSDAARARLRRAVAREIGAEASTRPWTWWERPLAFGLAGAAVFAAVFAVQTLSTSSGTLPNGARTVGSE